MSQSLPAYNPHPTPPTTIPSGPVAAANGAALVAQFTNWSFVDYTKSNSDDYNPLLFFVSFLLSSYLRASESSTAGVIIRPLSS